MIRSALLTRYPYRCQKHCQFLCELLGHNSLKNILNMTLYITEILETIPSIKHLQANLIDLRISCHVMIISKTVRKLVERAVNRNSKEASEKLVIQNITKIVLSMHAAVN